MPIAKATLYKILSTPEMGLYEASRRDGIKGLTAAQLKKKVERARKLRDKYKDLYRRQTIELRKNSTQGRIQGNKRTEQKQEVFTDILQRFEARMKQVEKEEKAAAKTKPAKAKATRAKTVSKKTAAKKTTAKKTTAKKTTRAKTVSKKTTAKKTAVKKTVAKKTVRKTARKAAVKQPAKVILPPVPDHAVPHLSETYVPPTSQAANGVPDGTDFINKQVEKAVKSQEINQSHNIAIEGHLSSRNRRFQGRRDNKG